MDQKHVEKLEIAEAMGNRAPEGPQVLSKGKMLWKMAASSALQESQKKNQEA